MIAPTPTVDTPASSVAAPPTVDGRGCTRCGVVLAVPAPTPAPVSIVPAVLGTELAELPPAPLGVVVSATVALADGRTVSFTATVVACSVPADDVVAR